MMKRSGKSNIPAADVYEKLLVLENPYSNNDDWKSNAYIYIYYL